MAEHKVTVPDIGDSGDVGVVEVLVNVGATVANGQALVVLESDKASMEIPATAAGVVRSIAIAVGDKVRKGVLIAVIDAVAAADAVAAPKASVPGAAAVPEPPTELDVLQLPPEVALPRTSSGRSRTLPPVPPPNLSEAPPKPKERVAYASPSVRKLARELGVDLAQIQGTESHGRISKEDVQHYVKHAMSVAGTATGAGFAVPEMPEIDFSQFGEISTQPLTKIQKLSGRNLHRSWVTIPHVTQFDEADITELEEFRKKMRDDRAGLKLTLVTFFMKAVVVVLKQLPRFNSSLDRSGETLILKQYFHIGVAVDTPVGLVVPVIRDVDLKGLHDLAKELESVSERARTRKLLPQDLQGASMTISSLGGIGGSAFTPIINPPEVAVLGVSRSSMKPVYKDGVFVPRLMCPLSLSYDHRVIDGADAARFTTRLREVLADIRQMLL